jgi:hypothetical protein
MKSKKEKAPKKERKKKTGRGGARKGAGRKAKHERSKTVLLAERVLEKYEGLTPLDVMMRAMQHQLSKNNEEGLMLAAAIAKDAAPYIHPRLTSSEISGKNGLPLAPPNIQIIFAEAKDGEFLEGDLIEQLNNEPTKQLEHQTT